MTRYRSFTLCKGFARRKGFTRCNGFTRCKGLTRSKSFLRCKGFTRFKSFTQYKGFAGQETPSLAPSLTHAHTEPCPTQVGTCRAGP